MSTTESDPLVAAAQVRREAGNVTPMTLWRWVRRGVLPAPVQINGRNYWPRSVVEALKRGAR